MKNKGVESDLITLGISRIRLELLESGNLTYDELINKLYEVDSTIGALSIDKIEKLAHEDFPYGCDFSLGSSARSLYENRKEAFVSGFNSSLNLR